MVNKVTIRRALHSGKLRLQSLFPNTYALEARLLMTKALGDTSLEYIIKNYNMEIQPDTLAMFLEYIEARYQGRPISHILGKKEFWGLEFKVSSHVLDPRPDSECLIETVLKYFPDTNTPLKLIDLGTGSGCLSIALSHEYKYADIIAADISREALTVARENAVKHNSSIKFIRSNWWDSIDEKYKFDLIICNPPYISPAEWKSLSVIVKQYEPQIALTDSKNGLTHYEKIAEQLSRRLDGIAILEIGYNQAENVKKILQQHNLKINDVIQDLSGNQRCIVASKN